MPQPPDAAAECAGYLRHPLPDGSRLPESRTVLAARTLDAASPATGSARLPDASTAAACPRHSTDLVQDRVHHPGHPETRLAEPLSWRLA